MRHFFIDKSELANPSPIITGSDAKHIKNVLRLKPGNEILLFDGEGGSMKLK
ncbi:RNA methyltransferase PUA domain-containing protein [Desulfonema magnum]